MLLVDTSSADLVVKPEEEDADDAELTLGKAFEVDA